MKSAVVVITAPTVEPISLDEAKAHVRQDGSEDNNLLSGLIKAARVYAEGILGRALITQTLELVMDDWPDGEMIELPRGSLQEVTSIKYTDDEGTETTFSTSDYIVETAFEPGRIVLVTDASWPTVDLRETGGIRIRFKAGYGAAGSDVPQTIRQALLLLIGHWYEHREETITGAVATQVPLAAKALLDMERLNWA